MGLLVYAAIALITTVFIVIFTEAHRGFRCSIPRVFSAAARCIGSPVQPISRYGLTPPA